MVSERSLDVLKVIVQDYVASREPVGSKSIVERHAFGVSAATIRHDMALLEEEELIAAPHTSSGRIPTDKGYRVFVNHLADLRPLTAVQRQAIQTFLGNATDLDEVLLRTVRLLSQLTHQVALVQYPTLGRSRIRHIEFVPLGASRILIVLITDTGRVEQRHVDVKVELDPEFLGEVRATFNTKLEGLGLGQATEVLHTIADSFHPDRTTVIAPIAACLQEQIAANRVDKLVMAGAATLATTPEDFGGSIVPVLEAIEEQVMLLRLFAEMEQDERGLATSIGSENAAFGLEGTSVLTSGYSSSHGEFARVGLLGPTRMDYPSNMAAVRAVARYLSRLLGED